MPVPFSPRGVGVTKKIESAKKAKGFRKFAEVKSQLAAMGTPGYFGAEATSELAALKPGDKAEAASKAKRTFVGDAEKDDLKKKALALPPGVDPGGPRDKDGGTALIKAPHEGRTSIAGLLSDKRADLEAKDKNGMAALITLDKDVLYNEASNFLYHMERFPGTVLLLVSGEQQLGNVVHRLHPAFVSGLKFVIQVPRPSAGERERLWKRALPQKCPVRCSAQNFADLGSRFALTGGQINKAVYRAAAAVALRPEGVTRVVTFKDLESAAETEKAKGEGEASRLYAQQFL